MNRLEQKIADEIHAAGAISFFRFMQLALYCPDYGYYEKETDIGKRGDFFTSVSVGSIFGELLGLQFSDWLLKLAPDGKGAAQGFGVAEAGAHDGTLAGDILKWFRIHRPELASRVIYWIVEPSARRRCRQQSTLAHAGADVRWVANLDELNAQNGDGFAGVLFSNELLDSFPVHRIGWDSGEHAWFEWGVALEGSRFVWKRIDLEGRSTLQPGLPAEMTPALPDGFTTELSPMALEWWTRSAEILSRGKLLTIDYGTTAEEVLQAGRTHGTLRAYWRHHLVEDLLARPGEQDLTAHVNFTGIQQAGEGAGLRTEQLVFQEQFLARIAGRIAQETDSFNTWTAAQRRQFQTLTHPEQLGRRFRVLVQSR